MTRRARKFGKHGVPTTDDKGLTPNATSGDGEDTGIDISNTPVGNVNVLVDGTQRSVGDGVDTKDCFFGESSVDAFTQVGAGENTGSGLRGDGSAWMWGDGAQGKTGLNVITDVSSPNTVVGNHSFVKLISVDNINVALKADGSAWTWGNGFLGRLGNNSTSKRSSPVLVVGNHSFTQIASAQANGYALKQDGSLWAWGTSNEGKLGMPLSVGQKSSPILVQGNHSFVLVSGRACIKADGSVWAWGHNRNGQVGDNTTIQRTSPTAMIGNHVFDTIASAPWNSTGDNQMHRLGLKADGTCWAWGEGIKGQLGQGTTAVNRSSPTSVVGGHVFTKIAAGQQISMGLKSDGSLWMWGENQDGRLGLDDTNDRSSPTSVLGDHSFTQIDGGTNTAIALAGDGTVWCWGSNTQGQLGINAAGNRSSPTSVAGEPFGSFVAKSLANIVGGDDLIWNGDVAGFDLTTEMKVDINYDLDE